MTQDELIAQQDAQRPARLFISFLSAVTGGDQSYAGEDGYSVNRPNQYQTVTPNYGIAVEGRPVSNLQNATLSVPLMLVLFAGVAFMVLKK